MREILSNSELYRNWREQLSQLNPDKRYEKYRLTNMLMLVVGLFKAESVHLSKLARKIPVRARKNSLVQRLKRFLKNPAIQVREWYQPVARQLVQAAASGGHIRLLVDTTKVGFNHRLLMMAIAYRRRSLPLAWCWVKGSRGHSKTSKQIQLLEYVQQLIPKEVEVSLVGDSEFKHTLLMEYCDFWEWDYVLRQPGRYVVQIYGAKQFQSIDDLPLEPGETRWLGWVVLTEKSAYPTHLVLHWEPGYKQPWYLATNQPEPRKALRLYRRRMWLEEMYGDLKGHGFDLEASHLRHAARLNRLTLAVCLLYNWLVATGEQVVLSGRSGEVDRTDRRDLSIFRIGWDFIERRLALNDPLSFVLVPSFSKLYGG
jgi:hypothetical protein